MKPQQHQMTAMPTPSHGHAIVIGGSIAGMTTARVLADHFARVTVIERDRLPETPEFRRGAPQARHAHLLLVRGQMILEEFFPGFVDELQAEGGQVVDSGSELEFFLFGAWRRPIFKSALRPTGCSRALLEHIVRGRITAHPRIQIVAEHEATALLTDDGQTRATGVRIRSRAELQAPEQELYADLVVDASGRGSRAPEWLESLGYAPPGESVINSFPGYATRIYRRPANFNESWKTMYIMPTPPGGTRGGVILPMEGDRWQVTLIGMARDYPPIDADGFMEFARSLPSPRFYEALQTAEPLTEPYGYRRAENRLRHYDKLPRYLENFLLCGDAVYAFNPVYGQGMTVAAMGAQALAKCLDDHHRRHGNDLTGLAQYYQKQLGKVIAAPWQLSTGEDRRWPETEGEGALDWMTRTLQGYFNRVLRTMVHDQDVAETFMHVQHMVKPPTALFHPRIVWKVLRPRPQIAPDRQPLRPTTSVASAAGD